MYNGLTEYYIIAKHVPALRHVTISEHTTPLKFSILIPIIVIEQSRIKEHNKYCFMTLQYIFIPTQHTSNIELATLRYKADLERLALTGKCTVKSIKMTYRQQICELN
jgi:hypothetical protein